MSGVQIRQALLAAALEDKPPSKPEFARRHGLTRHVCRRFPAEAAVLTAAYVAYQERETRRRYDDMLERYSEAAAALVDQGRTLGRKNLTIATGLVSYTSNPTRGNAMREVLERFNAQSLPIEVGVGTTASAGCA